MGKKLYGHNGSVKEHRRQKGEIDETDDDNWLTLAVAPGSSGETRRMEAACAAIKDVLSSMPTSSIDAAAGLLIEYALERKPEDEASWGDLVRELDEDDLFRYDDDDGDPLDVDAIVTALTRRRVACRIPPPLPEPQDGDDVLAVLEEDGEWHPAVVVEAARDGSRGPLLVRFVQWGKQQLTPRPQIVPLGASVQDEDASASCEGRCELCERQMQLTFHHLIPKMTHSKFLGKALPSNVAHLGAPTRDFLNSYGAMLCRACHSVVHRFAPNAVLATSFNTIELLAAQPKIQAWAQHASRQRS